jgi:hypothetical protein
MIPVYNLKILFISNILILLFCFVSYVHHLLLKRKFCVLVSRHKKETVVNTFRKFLCGIRNKKQEGLATCRGQ